MNKIEILNNIQSFIIFLTKIIILFFVIFIIFTCLFIFFIFRYSNQYITIKNFKANENSFLEIKNDIIEGKILLGKKLTNKCEKDNICEYNYELIDNEKRIKLNIFYIRVSKIKSDNYNISFYLDQKRYLQWKSPVLSFDSISKNNISGWYLPFPLSNNFFYIGSGYVDIDKNWTSFGYLDSAFD